MVCSTYIGDLEDPAFHWDGGNWSGNIPRGLYRPFPAFYNPYNARFHEWVKISGADCKQTDFDGFVARVNKQQIKGYIRFCYGDDSSSELEQLIQFVDSLDEAKLYGLVAECY